MEKPYQICTQCVMDTSDPKILFDAQGVCNHCRTHFQLVKNCVHHGEEGRRLLQEKVDQIKRDRRGDFDCVIGVSGGVDSSYVAFKVKELGLNPLAVHLDNGWDSELAVKNIENLLIKLGIELYTHVIDWEEFKDLQVSFLKASTPDSEVPSDHAIFSIMYQMAQKIGVKYLISGFNVKTETHVPRSWSNGHWDWKYIRKVQARFGQKELKTFPHMDFFEHFKSRNSIECLDLLNYIDYVKKDAIKILEEKLDWRNYSGKHFESIYTRFYQGYILPRKFGFDKRKSHFSSLICAGEMTRAEALQELQKPTYPLELQEQDLEYVVKKLGLSQKDFENIMALPPRKFEEFPSYTRFLDQLPGICQRGIFRSFEMAGKIQRRWGTFSRKWFPESQEASIG